MMTFRLPFLGILAAALAMLGGCTDTTFRADVTRFHEMPAGHDQGSGEGVIIEPMDPEKAGLEFAAYADIVGQHLAALGYHPAKGATPDIVARIDYSISEQAALRDGGSGSRIGIGIGGSSRHVGGGIGTSFGIGGGGGGPAYLSRLVVVLVSRESGQRLFEGRAENVGKNPDLAALMPLLADALFDGFPGVSGSSVRVTIPGAK